MKLELGNYVRDEKGNIGKIINQKNDLLEIDNGLITYGTFHPEIIKASHNIMDLIEVGDYVNGSPVCLIKKDEKDNTWIYTDSNYKVGILENEIETILTHEQFENNCYKIGDE